MDAGKLRSLQKGVLAYSVLCGFRVMEIGVMRSKVLIFFVFDSVV